MKWFRQQTDEGIILHLKPGKENLAKLIEEIQNLKGDDPEMLLLLTPENELNALRINVEDSTQPTEVLEKTKPWFNGPHTFPTIKIENPQEPTSLGINVSDGISAGDKVG